MKILALESSSDNGSAALWLDGEVHVRSGGGRHTHSELMLPWIGSLLGAAGLSLRQLDVIAFGAGPGSFTGIRLACGVAQGLALAADLPVIAVRSLDALALASGRAKAYICTDARMNEVYCAAYQCDAGAVESVVPAVVCAPEKAPRPPGQGWFGCGDGFAAYGGAAARCLADLLESVNSDLLPNATGVARLAASRYARGERPDPATVAPAYVRDKVALTTADRRVLRGLA